MESMLLACLFNLRRFLRTGPGVLWIPTHQFCNFRYDHYPKPVALLKQSALPGALPTSAPFQGVEPL